MFSSEFCELFKNAFFTEHLWESGSEDQADAHTILGNLTQKFYLKLVSAIFYEVFIFYQMIVL